MCRRIIIKFLMPLALFVLMGCEVKIPEEVIQPAQMEPLLYDYHLAQAMSRDIVGADYKKKLYSKYVLKKHGYTIEQFDSSMVWYSRNPKHLYDIYTSLQKRLDAEVLDMDNTTSNVAERELRKIDMQSDTLNLWFGRKTELLSATAFKNRLLYTCEADTTFELGDSIAMSFNVKFANGGNASVSQLAHTAMVVEYDDSTSVACGYSFADSGNQILTVNRNFNSKIKDIRSYIYYTDDDSLFDARMLVSDIKLLRIHPLKGELDEE